ncbi:MAG: SH3 domain-containing protein [Spirochaetes bacterium]|nr:SH3 domain-containing protein [Spirochaetota bacterium]
MKSRRFLPAMVLAFAAASMSGCSGLFGWGVVLWTFDPSAAAEAGTGTNVAEGTPASKDLPIPGGAVVPIRIKSNINHVFVVEAPGTRENVEVPLWRIEPFANKSAAERYAQAFRALARIYGLTLRDGLALRKAPSNLEKQVYRLKFSEPVKLLEKVEGQVVMTGGKPLEGDWYLALATDGTRGYVFSNQLRMYDETKEDRPVLEDAAAAGSDQVSQLFGRTWRPDWFPTMAESGRIDLSRFDLRFGLFPDAVRKTIRIELPDLSRIVKYEAITRQKNGSWRFDDQPVVLAFNGKDRVTVTFEKEDAPDSRSFSLFPGDIRVIVQTEELRRMTALAGIVRVSPCGSDDGTTFTVTRAKRFTAAAPSEDPALTAGEGSIELDIFVSDALDGSWNGGFSLKYDGRDAIAHWLYRIEGTKLTLSPLAEGDLSGAIAMAAPGSPVEFRAFQN